jgi:hypothetical protein
MFEIQPARDRKTLRRAVLTRCEAVADDSFQPIGQRLHDLSPDGAFLETDVKLDVGAGVYLAFRTPRTGVWVDAFARVVRIVRGRRASDRARGVGLQFEVIDPVDRAILAGSLRTIPPPIPARPRRRDYASTVRALAQR